MTVYEALMRDGAEKRARFEAAQAADEAAALTAPARTVADIPDAELLGRVVRAVTRKRPRRHEFAWVAVMEAFGLGSTYAAQLCLRFGIDPDTGADAMELGECKGAWELGTACGKCARCAATRPTWPSAA